MKGYLAIGWIAAILILFCVPNVCAHSGPFDGRSFKGRIAFSSDGNCNDEDDWGAFPVAVALLDAFGMKDELVHVDYCNIMPENDPRFYREMVDSVLGSAQRYDISRSIMFDYQKDLDGAIESIKNAINTSSAENPLYYVLAGPMEVAFLGIRHSDPDKRKYVYCISHSIWNDGFPQRSKEHLHRYNKRDIVESGINWVQVKPGRGLTNSTRTSSTPEQWALYHWMRDSKDPRLGWIYSRLEVEGRCNVSDATMTYFLLTGDEGATPAKLKTILDDKKLPTHVELRKEVRLEAENFQSLENYQLENRNDRSVSHRLSVRQSKVDTGRVRTYFDQPYTVYNGLYDVEVRFFDKKVGRSELKLYVNRIQKGRSWTASTDTDSWRSKIIPNVKVNTGDEIMVEVKADGEEVGKIDYIQLNYKAQASEAKNLKVAVVQTRIEPRLEDNLAKVLGFMDQAKKEQCRLVILPEHVLLPFEAPDKATKAELDAAFETIRRRALSAGLCVVFSEGYRRIEGGAYQTHGIVYTKHGTQAVFYRKNLDAPRPFVVDGVLYNLSVCSDRGYLEHSDLPCLTLGTQVIIDSSGGHGGDGGGKALPLIRYRPWAARTGAWVIVCNPVHEDMDFMGRSPWGDGSVKTRYAQLAASRVHLFQPGLSVKSPWFSLKGVPSIVTVGDDANWVEIGDLAVNRGMYLHFHISYESDASSEQATLRKQRNLIALCYARYGAIVNAADPSGLKRPSEPAGGMSMIVSREGGHNQPVPKGIEYYLPYQTSIVKSAGPEPTMIVAMRKTSNANNMDLNRFWRNRNRRQGGQPARYDWISNGAALIGPDELL